MSTTTATGPAVDLEELTKKLAERFGVDLKSLSTAPSASGMLGSPAPMPYLLDLDANHVSMRETASTLTMSVPRAMRRRLVADLEIASGSASPQKWTAMETLRFVAACWQHDPVWAARNEIAPILTSKGVTEVKRRGFSWPPNFIEGSSVAAELEAEGHTPEEIDILDEEIWIENNLDSNYVLKPSDAKLLALVERMSRTGAIINVGLRGETGVGKTSMAEWYAARYGRPLFIVDCSTIREPKDIFGYAEISYDAAGQPITTWYMSAFMRALQQPRAVVVLDEATRIHPSCLNNLLPLLDHRKKVFVEELKHTIELAEGVVVFVTANIGMNYTGTWTWDAAFENRIDYQIDIAPLDSTNEVSVLMSKTGISKAVAERLSKVSQKIRERYLAERDNLSHAASMRQLLNAAKAITNGATEPESLEYTVAPTYSTDGGPKSERSTVLQIIQGIYKA